MLSRKNRTAKTSTVWYIFPTSTSVLLRPRVLSVRYCPFANVNLCLCLTRRRRGRFYDKAALWAFCLPCTLVWSAVVKYAFGRWDTEAPETSSTSCARLVRQAAWVKWTVPGRGTVTQAGNRLNRGRWYISTRRLIVATSLSELSSRSV